MISNLITDRTQADVAYLRAQREKILNEGWAALSEAEQMEYLAGLKGGYNATDLNRITHAMEYLVERIRSYGYTVNYEKVKVPHQAQKTNHLPEGYTELEYIESTGTQYIDTGFKPNNNTRVVIDVDILETDVVNGLYGARDAGTTNAFVGFARTGDVQFNFTYGNNANMFDSPTGSNKGRFKIDQNKGTVTINGTEITLTSISAFQCNYDMYVMGANTTGTPNSQLDALKLYSCQIYDNGTLIRDFVPCTNASGTVGLYDLVNGIFYGNAGAGTFTAGAEIELPPVEILDDYTWYHSDIPQTNELNEYLQNVRWLRESMVLLPNTPEVPCDMEGFTFAEANDIEMILVNIETIINLMVASFIYSGEIFSGEVI